MPEATLLRTKHPVFLITFCDRHLAFHLLHLLLLLGFPVLSCGSQRGAYCKLFFTEASGKAYLFHGHMLPTDLINGGGLRSWRGQISELPFTTDPWFPYGYLSTAFMSGKSAAGGHQKLMSAERTILNILDHLSSVPIEYLYILDL